MKRPDLLNPELAEFIGILLGDGSIGHYECEDRSGRIKDQFVVKVTISKDERDYEEHICELFDNLFAKKPVSYPRKNENTLDIRYFGKDLFDFVTKEVGLKTSPKKGRALIPDRYLDSDLEKDLLRGFFDTDGSLVLTDNNGYLYPRLEIKISKSPMQDQFAQIIDDMGFRNGVYELENGKVRIQMNGKDPLKKWQKEIGFNNQRHLSKLEKL